MAFSAHSLVSSFRSLPIWSWLIIFCATLASNAQAQLEFNGEFNVFAKTESGDANVSTVSPDNGDGLNLFLGPGPHTRSVVLPEDPLSGDKRGGTAFSFSPTAKTEVTFDNGDLEVIAEAAVMLNGTVPKDDMFDYGYYPEASADLNMRVQDGIQLYPENTELYGKRATMEWVGDVTVSRMVVVNGSDTTQAQSAVDFSVGTPPGIDEFEGSLSENRDEGASNIQTDGPTNLSTPTTIILDRELVILGPPPLDEFSSEFNEFDVNVEASARVWTSGPSGATFRAEVTMHVGNIRLQRVTLEEDGSEIPLGQLKSISSSGYDWLGNGEPEVQLDEFSWNNAAGGSFGGETNWDPEAVPGSNDLAKFELPGTYSVEVETQEVEALKIGGDPSISVSFTNADLTVNGTYVEPAALSIDNGTFQLLGGTITSIFSTVGSNSATTVQVDGSSSIWSNTGTFTLGAGEVEVRAVNGGRFDLEELVLGKGGSGTPAEARLLAREFGSSIEMGNAQVGVDGAGYLRAEEGGSIVGEEVRLGVGSNSIGRLASLGREPGGDFPSTVELGELIVGYSGFGQAFVEDGGEMKVTDLVVGLFDVGTVEVSKPGSFLEVLLTQRWWQQSIHRR